LSCPFFFLRSSLDAASFLVPVSLPLDFSQTDFFQSLSLPCDILARIAQGVFPPPIALLIIFPQSRRSFQRQPSATLPSFALSCFPFLNLFSHGFLLN